jgi:hypothetical protein
MYAFVNLNKRLTNPPLCIITEEQFRESFAIIERPLVLSIPSGGERANVLRCVESDGLTHRHRAAPVRDEDGR